MKENKVLRRRTLAFLLSALVLPGAGQLYNHQYLKGLVIMVGFGITSLYLLVYLFIWMWNLYTRLTGFFEMERVPELNIPCILASLVLSLTFYVWGIVDAYHEGRKLEEAHENTSERVG